MATACSTVRPHTERTQSVASDEIEPSRCVAGGYHLREHPVAFRLLATLKQTGVPNLFA